MRRASLAIGARQAGIVLMEATVALGLAVFLALMVMKGFLLAISGNQWTVMQTLTDAYLTRETALSNRVPVADLTTHPSAWPDSALDVPPTMNQTVSLGALPGGSPVVAQLIRFRVNETPLDNSETNVTVWCLHSVLSYSVGEQQYVKSRSTIRTQ